jgi:uncharacterized protein YydD (DUF2326 family)
MIKKISANQPSFKTVELQPGFNVILADRTKESTKKDSRNGLGKSTLIQIIHFCLGAKALPGKGLLVEPLKGWEFSLAMEVDNRELTVTRQVDNPRFISIQGDIAQLPVSAKNQKGRLSYGISDWNSLLGQLLFGLMIPEAREKYQPSFRSLVSYYIRRGRDSFSTPFENHRKQQKWDIQVNNAFLLGLAWEDAAEMAKLEDRRKGLNDFKNAAKSGVVEGFLGSLGDLEARKVRLSSLVELEASQLQSFRVHAQYQQLQADANQLTDEIHELVNANTMAKRRLDLYGRSLNAEKPPLPDSMEKIYQEAGIALPGVTLRRLEEVRNFHNTIIDNRRAFLAEEIEEIKHLIDKRDHLIRVKTEKRSSLMEILSTHGALEEYTLLQRRHLTTVSELNAVKSMIENLKAFESGLSEVRIAQERLQQTARRDYEERRATRERAISLFNGFSEALYDAPGKLIVDFGPTGFKFDVEIERSGSSGIDNMKVFCYDLMLACLWARRKPSLGLLIHDSTIFDGVDERQRALALEIAASESRSLGFQYICTLNSDNIPWTEFSSGFDLKKDIKLTLTDESADGGLLGIRF